MLRELKRYIKDIAIVRTFTFDKNDEPKFNKLKLKRHMLTAIRNYSSLRLKILQNDKVEEIEQKIIVALVKSAVKSAIKNYNINIGDDSIDKVVETIIPGVTTVVHQLRSDIFTCVLEYCTGKLDESN